MKLITLNTWGGAIAEPLKKFLTEKGADTDIFCFQEVFNARSVEENDPINIKGSNTNLFEDMRKILSEHTGIFCSVYEKIYGIAMFVRKGIEIVESGEIVIYKNDNFAAEAHLDGVDHGRKMQWLCLPWLICPKMARVLIKI